jgi:uncharacterized protein
MKVIDRALDRDFVWIGRSSIAGRGLFAKRRIPRGTRIIEYKGVRRAAADAGSNRAGETTAPILTFRLSKTTVIDAAKRGNESRFINHSCAPNCKAWRFGKKIFIYALRDIQRHEELTFDYQLRDRDDAAEAEPDAYRCNCGSPSCRGTMLSPRREKNCSGGFTQDKRDS